MERKLFIDLYETRQEKLFHPGYPETALSDEGYGQRIFDI